jgi:cyanophycin synthetase
MAKVCPGDVIYFAPDRHHPVLATHRAQGKRCIYVENGHIVACEGNWRENLPLAEVPLTRGGLITFQIENAMAAVGAAWGVGLSWDAIRAGLASFVSDSDNAPGRFNLMDYHGATLIADYGHNPDAMRALVSAVNALPGQRRSVVISGAGDRRDEDIREQTQILGAAFDDVILYQDACQRGREDGEVLGLLRQGLEGAPRTRTPRKCAASLRPSTGRCRGCVRGICAWCWWIRWRKRWRIWPNAWGNRRWGLESHRPRQGHGLAGGGANHATFTVTTEPA